MTDTLRIEARFKNARLYNAIREATPLLTDDARKGALQHNGPVQAFCRLNGLSRSDAMHIYKLLNLRMGPIVKLAGRSGKQRVRPLCQTLAALLERDVEWLFPEDLYAIQWPALAVEVPHQRFVPLLAAPRAVLTLPPGQEEQIEHEELRREIGKALRTLTPRQEKIIRMRFGLDGEEQSLDEVGNNFAVTPERIRQIEAKALRQLRHPSRSRALRPFAFKHYVPERIPKPPPPVEVDAHVAKPVTAAPAPPRPRHPQWVSPQATARVPWRFECFLLPEHLRSGDWIDEMSKVYTHRDGTFDHVVDKIIVPIKGPDRWPIEAEADPRKDERIFLIAIGTCRKRR